LKYEESYAQFDAELLDLVLRAIPESFTNALQASGIESVFPLDNKLEFKIKYDVGEEGGALTLKFSWDDESGEDDEDDDSEDDEEDEEEDEESTEDED